MPELTESQRVALAALLVEHPDRPDLAPLRELAADPCPIHTIGSGCSFVGFRAINATGAVTLLATGGSRSAVHADLAEPTSPRLILLSRPEVRQLRDALTVYLNDVKDS